MSDMARQRANMVESQVRPNAVSDPRILGAMYELPREAFVPGPMRSLAYMDAEIALDAGPDGPGRAMVAPMPLARLVQLAGVKPTDLVLDVGVGPGYSTALLARLADSVVGLEVSEALARAASATLADLGIDNAAVVTGALEAGCAEEGPYDVILVAGSVAQIPDALIEQLKPGGRLVTVIRRGPLGRATLITRGPHATATRAAFDCAAPALPGFAPAPAFVF